MSKKQSQSKQLLELIDRIARVLEAERRTEGLNATQQAALHFLSRANKFSRGPTAVAAWLRQTKGTVSQTLSSLESKGLIHRESVAGDKRAVRLSLTKQGVHIAQKDPIHVLATLPISMDHQQLASVETELANYLRNLLDARDGKTFAECRSCRHFCTKNENGRSYRCGLLDVPLTIEDSKQICVEHEYPAA